MNNFFRYLRYVDEKRSHFAKFVSIVSVCLQADECDIV